MRVILLFEVLLHDRSFNSCLDWVTEGSDSQFPVASRLPSSFKIEWSSFYRLSITHFYSMLRRFVSFLSENALLHYQFFRDILPTRRILDNIQMHQILTSMKSKCNWSVHSCARIPIHTYAGLFRYAISNFQSWAFSCIAVKFNRSGITSRKMWWTTDRRRGKERVSLYWEPRLEVWHESTLNS